MSTQPILISVPPATELERILYATDFSLASERALPIVSTIARQYGSQVFLAHIWTSTPYSEPYMSVMPLRDEEKESRRLMMDLLRRPELANLNTTIEIKGGDPVERINEYVQRHGIGLVVIGTHGWSGFTHKMMGSVAEELLRTLKCAVLTIGPNLGPRFAFPKTIKDTIKSILFPTDLSPESKAVFPYLATLAADYEAEIMLLHVLPTQRGTNPDGRKVAESLQTDMRRMFSPQLSPQCRPQYIVGCGEVAAQILSVSNCYQSDLIGMGVRQGNHLATHLRTTVAYQVASAAECPVLTVRGTL